MPSLEPRDCFGSATNPVKPVYRGQMIHPEGQVLAAAIVVMTLASCGGASRMGASPHATSPPQRGTKGERPGLEAESSWHIGRRACAAIGAGVERRHGVRVRIWADASPPLSHCRISGEGLNVDVYLDAAFAARQRYENRMVEATQFGAPDPRKVPHPVPGVGEHGTGNHNANWIPVGHSLFVLQGNRWVTVEVGIQGLSERHLLAEASSLARAAFRLATR